MTVTEKLAHAAERKAFETMLDSLIRKSRTQDVGKVADDLVSICLLYTSDAADE